MDNKDRNNKAAAAGKLNPFVPIVIAGIFVLAVVFVFSRVLFSSNSSTVPEGLDTATIGEEKPVTAKVKTTTKSQEGESSSNLDSAVDMESSKTENGLGVMYITEYAYLHTEPSNDATNIICMSPGIQVTVLGYEDNGYVKITFQNIDEPLTGYIYKDYLSEVQTVVPAWEQY